MTSKLEFYEELEKDIQGAYVEGVTIDQAERLAAKFLGALLQVGKDLQEADLDARMRRSGLKAVKAAVYMENATKSDKKPSDVMLAAMVDMDKLVMSEQSAFDEAEVKRDRLQAYYHVFKESHVYFRGISKGRFE